MEKTTAKNHVFLFSAMMGILIMTVTLSNLASGNTVSSKNQFKPVLENYLSISTALSHDKTEGVINAAEAIKRQATALKKGPFQPEHTKHLEDIVNDLYETADKLTNARNISEMRSSLKDLSRPMIVWANISTPKGLSVAYCSMAPGYWLQQGTEIQNPYFGLQMSQCGEITNRFQSSQGHVQTDHRQAEHSGSDNSESRSQDNHQHSEGYGCAHGDRGHRH